MSDSNNGPLHIERRGSDAGDDGPTMILTHGYGDDSSTWTELADALSKDHRIVTWDLRLHGRSTHPSGETLSIKTAAGDLAGIVAETGPPGVLTGHSLGGYLSLRHAIVHPHDVTGLIVVATGPGFRDEGARNKWNRTLRKNAERMKPPAAAVEMAVMSDSLVVDDAETIQIPTLLIVGAADQPFRKANAFLEHALPNCRSVMVPEAGHHPHRDQHEFVLNEITSFVSGLEAAR